MVSGPKAEIDLVKDALAVFGKVFVIGDKPGMAQTMKLANNFLSATAMAATSEAVAMGVKAGPRSGGDDRRHQRRQRPEHRIGRKISAGDSAAHVQLRLRHGADGQGRAAVRSRKPRTWTFPNAVMSAVARSMGNDQHGIRRRQRFHRHCQDGREARRRHCGREEIMSDDIQEVYAVCYAEPRAQALGELHLRRSARRDDVARLLRLGDQRTARHLRVSTPASTKPPPRNAAARSSSRSAKA